MEGPTLLGPRDPRAYMLWLDDFLCWFYVYKLLARFGHNDRELVGHHVNFIGGRFVDVHFAELSDQLIGARRCTFCRARKIGDNEFMLSGTIEE